MSIKNTGKPLVSVGIPTYNRPDGLSRTLDCITQQSYRNLEIIVSDNGSAGKRTQEIVNEFMLVDSRIQYHQQSQNMGPVFNFKFVLGKATGEYFMWAADDDSLDDNYIEQCLYYLSTDASYSAVGGHAVYITEAAQNIESKPLNVESDKPIQRVIQYYKHISKGYGNCIFYGLMRTELIRKAHLSNEFANDSATIAEIAFMGKIKTVKTTHLYYSLSGDSKTVAHVVKLLKLPKWNELFPGLASSIVFVKDIFYSDIYSINLFIKIYLSINILFITGPMYQMSRLRTLIVSFKRKIFYLKDKAFKPK